MNWMLLPEALVSANARVLFAEELKGRPFLHTEAACIIDMKYPISVQWHITAACQHKCRHCYMFEPSTRQRELERQLSLDEKIRVLDQLEAFGQKWDFSFHSFTLMGGDPLLAPDAFEFIEELRRRGKRVSMGGNPETLSDEALSRLKELGIVQYQLSLDGLEDTHDLTRGPGSFRMALEGFERLEKYGIAGTTMATLTPLNVDEFFDLAVFVRDHTRCKGFAFDFVSRVGNGRGFDQCFSPEQALDLSRRYLRLKKESARIRPDFHFHEKPGAMRLLHMEQCEIALADFGDTAPAFGCLIGRDCVAILSDGTLLSCRRMPEIIGRLPEDDFEEIFLRSPVLRRYRRPQFYEACGSCIGWNWCRGCPATAYAEPGGPFSKPITCYAHLLNMDTKREHAPVPMDFTDAQEVDLIKRGMRFRYLDKLFSRNLNPDVVEAVELLEGNSGQCRAFTKDPEAWAAEHFPSLSRDDLLLISGRTYYNVSDESIGQ